MSRSAVPARGAAILDHDLSDVSARPLVGLCDPPRVVAGPTGKRGPKTRVSDAELVEEIRAVLAACPFHGEGYRKVRARLAHRGRAVSGKRVLRLMRARAA